MAPEICPNCGAIVPPKAKACPECGADEKTGWSDTAYADRLGIPEENFDYDRFVKEEFAPARVKPRGIHWIWWLTALLLVLLFLFFFFR
jgi:RNA polymerase subunit RPABC4/transcription elongation factor Spt4